MRRPPLVERSRATFKYAFCFSAKGWEMETIMRRKFFFSFNESICVLGVTGAGEVLRK